MRLARTPAWLTGVCFLAATLALQGTIQSAEASSSSVDLSSSSSSSSSRILLQAPAPRPGEPCQCSRISSPVCGTDQKTYNNECLAACAGVEVDYEGECYDYEGLEAPTQPPSPPQPAAAAGGGGAAAATPAAGAACIQPCPETYNPVCGADGRTYANSCTASCRNVAVIARGICPADSSATATASDVRAGCVCPAVYAPVCGSDSKTYSNSCRATCAGVQVASKAACEEQQTTGTTVQPTTASTDAKGCACPTALKPVCTTTGVTRSNECLAACKGEKIAYTGACRAGTVASVSTPAVPTRPALRPTRKPGCVCAAMFDPVCGADGNTYPNRCEAGCHNMVVGTAGECGGSPTGGILSVPAPTASVCVAKCPREGKQACGINGQTYINTCIAQCYGVQIAYPGACKPRCDACPRDWNPYCIATGGWGPRTFANCCFAKCNNVKILSQVLHAGACSGACTEKCDSKLEKPLCCGGKTYKNGCFALCLGQDTNQCSAGRCSSVANVDKGLGCLLGPCNVKCNGYAYQEPVCGSDGKTYPDKCHLLCNQQVSIVAPGKCGVCAPNQPGGFPYCSPTDNFGFAPVCGADGVTYRNKAAAWAAGVTIAAGAACDKNCGEVGEACYTNSSPAGSTCCEGVRCQEPVVSAQQGSKQAAGVCVAAS